MRTFIAIELSKEIKEALKTIEDELQGLIRGIRWIPPENIHLTLKFLGSIEVQTVEAIKNILSETAKEFKQYKIRLSSLGAFPNPARPRVIWVGVGDGSKECVDMAGFIEERASNLGIEKESRTFHPHLTLARVKFLKDKDSVRNAFAKIKITPKEMYVKKITLFQSELIKEGARYTPLWSADLE
ncbi:MAG: RNA 2',3'-cyclic phosphodiesterase [Candidatus Omnitrophica bacterium]|nr:RNA 2',3'-cyclic phosphodiesterase [Candidatus Omnitrophota bacterium]